MSKKNRKQQREKWLRDVLPGTAKTFEKYETLPARDLAIVAGAVLDIALAELLSKRFIDYPDEIDRILGWSGGDRAPLETFASRIQMTLLLGVIHSEDAAMLRSIKEIRNHFAHRVNMSFAHADVHKPLQALYDGWLRFLQSHEDSSAWDYTAAFKSYRSLVGTDPEFGAFLFLQIFAHSERVMVALSDRTKRIFELRK